MKILLKNGKIYDGTGADAFVGDILVENDKIAKVGKSVAADSVDKTVDLKGLSVSSGFIDAHSHNDWFAIRKEPLKFFEPFIRQGITSFVTGNCGLSAVGFDNDSAHVGKMGGGLFFFNETTGVYGDVAEFFKAVDKNNPCNIAALVGHCSARASVAGFENRPLEPKEEARMLEILDKALENGACGISLGLMYEPGLYADTEELKKVAAICLKHNKPLTVHARANSKVSMAYKQLTGRSHLLRALDELAEIAKGTPLKLHYSHAIFVGRKSFADADEFLKISRELREAGVDFMFDIYDELLGVSVITVILPTWYQAMSEKDKKKKVNRLKLRALCAATSKLLGFGFPDIQIAYIGEGYEKYEGKTVRQIAEESGLSDFDAYLKMCELSKFNGRVNMGPYSTKEIINRQCKESNVLYMTDAWVEDFGVQNPAIYDCFPKFLRDSLLGAGDSMPNTVRKMTGATADRFCLDKRGYLKEGYYADLTVFDEAELKAAIPDQPKAFGIKAVFINGKEVLEGENLDKKALKTSGRAMRVERA
jgi:N-acyl-D-amino-acid deacylase